MGLTKPGPTRNQAGTKSEPTRFAHAPVQLYGTTPGPPLAQAHKDSQEEWGANRPLSLNKTGKGFTG